MSKTMKNIGVALLSIGMIGGTIALGNHLMSKNTHETIHPTFEVGGLDVNGKYINDNSTIYTKQKFACDGLQATLDFDSTINYKVFYYDNVDNFISSTDVLTNGYNNENVPTLGAYARVMITPLQDMDRKVSWTEKYQYASQLNLKVSKNAEENVNKLYKSIGSCNFKCEYSADNLKFELGKSWDPVKSKFGNLNTMSATTENLLIRGNNNYLKCDTDKVGINVSNLHMIVYQYGLNVDGSLYYIGKIEMKQSNSFKCKLDANTSYVLFNASDSSLISDANLQGCIIASPNEIV